MGSKRGLPITHLLSLTVTPAFLSLPRSRPCSVSQEASSPSRLAIDDKSPRRGFASALMNSVGFLMAGTVE